MAGSHSIRLVKLKSNVFNFNKKNEIILSVDDYVSIPNILNARQLTDRIFIENRGFVENYYIDEYQLTWSWYSDVFQFCIKYFEIKLLIDKIKSLNVENITIVDIDPQYCKVIQSFFFDKNINIVNTGGIVFFKNVKQLLFNFVMLLFSMLSIFFFILRPGRNVGTYTGDFIYKNTKSDFRLNHLYEKYKQSNIQYIEFIRSTKIKNFFINIFKRKRFAIYYTSIIYFVDLFTRNINSKHARSPENFYQSVLFKYHDANITLKRSILIIEKILNILKLDKLVLISFSSRSAPLSFASKLAGIKTVGIMHGLQQKEDSCHEFMESYDEQKKIGCDVYGVWSAHYLEYFKKYSKISNTNAFKYSGLLRPVKGFCSREFDRVDKSKIKVLLISEPLVSVEEMSPYIKSLLKYNDIELGIKIRPMYKDIFFSKLKKKLPIVNNCKVYDGKIEDVAKDFDVFLGSNSTAVIEASLFGKLSILVDTVKFGDYFEMDSILDNQKLLVRNSESIYKNILYRVNNESSLDTISTIRYRFFGDNKDGAQWIVDQL